MGDGTTSVIVLAGEILAMSEQFLEQNIHPTIIIKQYRNALENATQVLEQKASIPIDTNDREKLRDVVSIPRTLFTQFKKKD